MSRNASVGIFRLCRRYSHSSLTSELDASSWSMRSGFVKRVSRAVSQAILRIYDALLCIIYTQEYRSGHNEAVLKTVCPKGTGVRIPLPAPKNKDTPCGCPLFFATVRGSRTPLCDSPSRRMGFAFERKPSG